MTAPKADAAWISSSFALLADGLAMVERYKMKTASLKAEAAARGLVEEHGVAAISAYTHMDAGWAWYNAMPYPNHAGYLKIFQEHFALA